MHVIKPQLYHEANKNSVAVSYIWNFILKICVNSIELIDYQVSTENKLKHALVCGTL